LGRSFGKMVRERNKAVTPEGELAAVTAEKSHEHQGEKKGKTFAQFCMGLRKKKRGFFMSQTAPQGKREQRESLAVPMEGKNHINKTTVKRINKKRGVKGGTS